MKYKIKNDVNGFYENDTVVSGEQLVSDYLGVMEEIEDADYIGYVKSLPLEEAIYEIAISFGLDIKEVD